MASGGEDQKIKLWNIRRPQDKIIELKLGQEGAVKSLLKLNDDRLVS